MTCGLLFSSRLGCQIFSVSLIVIIYYMVEDLCRVAVCCIHFFVILPLNLVGTNPMRESVRANNQASPCGDRAAHPEKKWQWTSFLSAIPPFVFHMLLLLLASSKLRYAGCSGDPSTLVVAVFSTALGIMCGAVGYMGTSAFVRKIYTNVKID
ncbi:transmembrane 9 superfamily member 3 [Lates japonicus]|uniref:Transmembrane 9 superfamily member 3 n=1 Tax=Lates japonicus TaxID=270547 RepID=A0AAD3MF02_LATJO|nr:transmembrane 9 superfamily member 3 [Lates japonicus]